MSLGPLTSRLVRRASEIWDDLYPAWQGYAHECEAFLEFIADRNQFARFLPRLVSSRQKRDEALNAIRVAYLMESLGYSIFAWEPTDAAPYKVEFHSKAEEAEVRQPSADGYRDHETRPEVRPGEAGCSLEDRHHAAPGARYQDCPGSRAREGASLSDLHKDAPARGPQERAFHIINSSAFQDSNWRRVSSRRFSFDFVATIDAPSTRRGLAAMAWTHWPWSSAVVVGPTS